MTDGFLVHRTHSPLGLGLVVAAHVGVIAALALSVTHVITPTEIFTQVRNIDEPPPPPPVKHSQRPTPTHAASTIDRVQPTITIPATPTGPIVDKGPVTIDLPPIAVGPIGPPMTIKATPPAPIATDASLDPRYAGVLQPPYPPALERAGTEGNCTVRVLIGADGRVHDVQQVAADDPLFFAATKLQALRHWRFRPATRDGGAVEAWKTMTVRFHLDG